MTLTEKQQAVYRFIRDFIEAMGIAPSYDEIRQHFGFQSFQSVQKYLNQLERKGYLKKPGKNQKRGLTLVEHGGNTVVLPLAGVVAAGQPIEAIEDQEHVHVPEEMLGRGDYFALTVQGNSMIDDGIFDGDTIIVQRQATAANGQTVVALIEGEATVKRFYRHADSVELRPANTSMKPFFIREGAFEIRGVVVGLMRRYR